MTKMDVDYAAARSAIDEQRLIAVCQEVLRVPSVSGEEQAVSELVAERFRELGFDDVRLDDRFNVIATIRGIGNGPSLMINGHLDTVPPGDMEDPHSGAIVDGARWNEPGPAIYGRGACDMKCNIVAAAFGAAAVHRAGIRLAGDVIVVADVGEEVDSPDGVPHVIESGIMADYGLSVESTNLAVYQGHRGKVEFELTVRGRSCHSSEPSKGLNAVDQATQLIAALANYGKSLPSDPILGEATVAITDIRALPGGRVAVVPHSCVVRIDRRYVRGETVESLTAEFAALVDEIKAKDAEFDCSIEAVNHFPLLFTDSDNPIIQIAKSARARVIGDEGALGAWRFGVNGTFMAQAGIPTAGLGPGREEFAHTMDEHVPVSDLINIARMYASAVIDLCGARSAS